MTDDLSALTDAALCSRAQAGCRESSGVLVARHTGLVRKILNGLRVPPQVYYDDLAAVGHEAVWHAAMKFRPDGGAKFSTYAFTCCSNAVRRELANQQEPTGFQASRVRVNVEPGDEEGTDFLSLIPDREHVEPDPTVREWVAGLPPIQREVVGLCYGLDGVPRSWSHIAEQVGLTIPQAKLACQMATGSSVAPVSPRRPSRRRSRGGRAATPVC